MLRPTEKMGIVLISSRRLHQLGVSPIIDTSPYTAVFEKIPPREITGLINFPQNNEYQFDRMKFYNNTVERAERRRIKYKKIQPKVILYQVGDKVLLKNRKFPSTIEGIAKKLLLLYTGPYTITKNNNNNT